MCVLMYQHKYCSEPFHVCVVDLFALPFYLATKFVHEGISSLLQRETRRVYNLLMEDIENFDGWKIEPG